MILQKLTWKTHGTGIGIDLSASKLKGFGGGNAEDPIPLRKYYRTSTPEYFTTPST